MSMKLLAGLSPSTGWYITDGYWKELPLCILTPNSLPNPDWNRERKCLCGASEAGWKSFVKTDFHQKKTPCWLWQIFVQEQSGERKKCKCQCALLTFSPTMDFLPLKWLFLDINFLHSTQSESAFLPKWNLLTTLRGFFFLMESICRNSRVLAFSQFRMGLKEGKIKSLIFFRCICFSQQPGPCHPLTWVSPFLAHPGVTLVFASIPWIFCSLFSCFSSPSPELISDWPGKRTNVGRKINCVFYKTSSSLSAQALSGEMWSTLSSMQ